MQKLVVVARQLYRQVRTSVHTDGKRHSCTRWQAPFAYDASAFAQALKADLDEYEQTCSELHQSVKSHAKMTEDAYTEVCKGNSIIKQLAQDLADAKDTILRKHAVLCCQVHFAVSCFVSLTCVGPKGMILALHWLRHRRKKYAFWKQRCAPASRHHSMLRMKCGRFSSRIMKVPSARKRCMPSCCNAETS